MYLFIQGLKSAGIWLLLHTATSEKLQIIMCLVGR